MKCALSLVPLLVAGTAVAQPTPTPPTPTPTPVPETPMPTPTPVIVAEPPVAVVTEAPKLEPVKKLQVGSDAKSTFTPGVLLQGWVFTDTTFDKTPTSTFRVRRAEISFKGDIIAKQVAYKVMFDPAGPREFANATLTDSGMDTVVVKQPSSIVSAMQDLEITFLSKHVDVSIGQFKIPVSWEGYNSSAKIITPERAVVSNLLGDKRDLGIKLTKFEKKYGYYLAVFNGLGKNNLDNNNQKDVALRIEVYPIEGLTIAGMTYDSIGYRKRAGTKDRWELDLRYDHAGFLFQSEFIIAKDVAADKADAITARGFYALVAYTIKNPAFKGELQPLVRVGYLDPDTSKDVDPTMAKGLLVTDELTHYDVGLNYYLKGHEMKLQGSYSRQQFQTAPANNQIILGAQVSY